MKKCKVLLTGGSGLLGTYIRKLNPDILSLELYLLYITVDNLPSPFQVAAVEKESQGLDIAPVHPVGYWYLVWMTKMWTGMRIWI